MSAKRDKLLALVIPVFEVEKYLPALLESLTLLPVKRVQIIFVDDCGKDNSVSIIEEWIKKQAYDCQLVHHSRNRGLSAARNTGIQHAQSEYVWFVDSDDMISETFASIVLSYLEAENPDILFFDFLMVEEQFGLVPDASNASATPGYQPEKRGFEAASVITNRQTVLDELMVRPAYYAWSYVTRTSLAIAEPFPEGMFFEDIATTPRLIARASTFFHVPEIGIYYRQRSGSILNVPSLKKSLDMIESGMHLPEGKHGNDVDEFFAFTHIQALLWGLQMCHEALKIHQGPKDQVREQISRSVNAFKNRKQARFAIRKLASTRGRHAWATATVIKALPSYMALLLAKVLFSAKTRRLAALARRLLP